MTFDADTEFAAIEALLDELFAPTSVIYTSPDGTQTTLTGQASAEYTSYEERSGIMTRVRRWSIRFSLTDLPTHSENGTFTIADVEWSIAKVIYSDSAHVVFELSRHELTEHTRPGYRRQ